MKTRHVKIRPWLPVSASICALALTLSACTSAEKPSGPTPSASVSASTSAKDALTLKGPVEAATVPEVKPVVSNPQPKLPTTLTDTTGKTITVSNVDRILALDLYGTLTDTLIGLGMEDHLVGRSNSDTQPSLKNLPVVTQNGHDLNTEAVLNLHPTLILTNTTVGTEDKYRQLEATGVKVIRFESTPRIAKIDPAIMEVGQALGLREPAQQLVKDTDQGFEKAKTTISSLKTATPTPPRAVVLYVRGTAGIFFILGKDYGASDVIDSLGLDDVASANGITELKPANPESLLTLDPQVILAMKDGVASTGGLTGLLKRPGLAATPAGENQRVITAADGQLLSYGPRTPANLVALAEAIYTQGS